jgi:hypothetical protein
MWPHAHTTDQLQARATVDKAVADWQALNAVAEAVKNGKFPIEP